MKKFCKSLKEQAMEIIKFKKKKMKPLTNEQQKYICKICYICKEKFEDKHAKDKTSLKVRDYCHDAGE